MESRDTIRVLLCTEYNRQYGVPNQQPDYYKYKYKHSVHASIGSRIHF